MAVVTLALIGSAVALATPAAAVAKSPAKVAGLRLEKTWNVRATPGGTKLGSLVAGPVTVECQAAGPRVVIPGTGVSAIWDRVPGRGYVTDLAVVGTDKTKADTRIPTCPVVVPIAPTAPTTPTTPTVPTAPAAPGPAGYNAQVLAEAGSWALDSAGGQCKVWAAKVVNAVLARAGVGRIGGYESRGGAYWGSYANAGGVRVTAAQAAPGDLIQTNNPADRRSNVHYTGMHSAIVVARTATPGTFVVRDSNWHGDERVGEHLWTPDRTAQKWGLETNYWRFGTVSTSR